MLHSCRLRSQRHRLCWSPHDWNSSWRPHRSRSHRQNVRQVPRSTRPYCRRVHKDKCWTHRASEWSCRYHKTTFALKNRLIPPNLNFEIPNPQINLQGWHLKVPTTPVPWPQDKLLRASVSNFRYGGTNSHLILEPPPASSAKKNGLNGHANGHNGVHNCEANGSEILNRSSNGVHNGNEYADVNQSRVFILSAKDSVACQTMMDIFATHVGTTKPSVSDLAYTLANRRSMHLWVATVRARTIDELRSVCEIHLSSLRALPNAPVSHSSSTVKVRNGMRWGGNSSMPIRSLAAASKRPMRSSKSMVPPGRWKVCMNFILRAALPFSILEWYLFQTNSCATKLQLALSPQKWLSTIGPF